MPSTLLLPLPLPADEVKIGSFLVNPSDPTQDYFHPQDHDPGLKPSILRVDVTDFTNTIRDAGTKEVEAVLTSYFSTTIDWAKSKSLELSSAKAATYLMRNSGYWFEQACALARMRWWFELVSRRGHKIYLLVGLRTIFDGHFRLEHTTCTSTGGQLRVPADVLAGLPPMGLDVGGGGKVSKDQTASSEFSAAGERIWALKYRHIKFKWYSSKKMENAALETSTRWVTFNRYPRDIIMWCGCRDDQTGHVGANTVREPGHRERLKRGTLPDRRPVGRSYSLGPAASVPVEPSEARSFVSPVVETLDEDTEDMVEGFIDDELDLADQVKVQNRAGETLYIPQRSEDPSDKTAQQARSWVMPRPIPMSSPMPFILPPIPFPHLKTAADDPEADVQLSNEASIIKRPEHLESLLAL